MKEIAGSFFPEKYSSNRKLSIGPRVTSMKSRRNSKRRDKKWLGIVRSSSCLSKNVMKVKSDWMWSWGYRTLCHRIYLRRSYSSHFMTSEAISWVAVKPTCRSRPKLVNSKTKSKKSPIKFKTCQKWRQNWDRRKAFLRLSKERCRKSKKWFKSDQNTTKLSTNSPRLLPNLNLRWKESFPKRLVLKKMTASWSRFKRKLSNFQARSPKQHISINKSKKMASKGKSTGLKIKVFRNWRTYTMTFRNRLSSKSWTQW